MNSLSTLLTIVALGISTAAPARVNTLLPQYTRNIIYNTPVVLPDSTAVMVIDEEEDPEMNMMFFDGEEMVSDHDSLYIEFDEFDPFPLPKTYFRPVVYDGYYLLDSIRLEPTTISVKGVDPLITEWIDRATSQELLMRHLKQNYILNHPQLIKYDESKLPEPPKEYTATVDPVTASILLKEVVPVKEMPKTELEAKFGKKHWLKSSTANLQFSQAYVSPNWYQGGNNNLNALLNLYYNVKLNQAFHPKLLFENTFQYKLGMNNAPDDELHDYNISEDIFQWNMTAGYKSTRRWYYSMNLQFKTQLLNNYKPNSNTLKAAFMSPGELNLGIGMTYNYTNPKKTLTFDASISPFSYNMKTCLRHRMNETSFGIEEGRKTVSEYGSSAEGKLQWQLCENISLRSRLFVFTDYDYVQSDLENTLMFTINRFLTTQIYVHVRYDSTSPLIEDTDWHKFMMKEILSFGFTYKFNT